MSADESFLARWSRRKRDAATAERDRLSPETTEHRAPHAIAGTADAAQETDPLANLASLPPIESISAGSDIRAFLAPGVPADLARAALRSAWSADPAIRDFIGLSENSWDFTAPDGVPGFGSVTVEEAQRLLRQLLGEPNGPEVQRPAPERLSDDQTASLNGAKEEPELGVNHAAAQPRADTNYLALQHEFEARELRPPPKQSRHGGALPE
jgi:Protein of unknown function (DUF3306)